MEQRDRDQRNTQFVRFWFFGGRMTAAFALAGVSAIVVYKLAGWPIVSALVGALLVSGALVLMTIYAPPQ